MLPGRCSLRMDASQRASTPRSWNVFGLGARRWKLGRTCRSFEIGGRTSFSDRAAHRLTLDICQVSTRRTHRTSTGPVQGDTCLDCRDSLTGLAVMQLDDGTVRAAQHLIARFAIARRMRLERRHGRLGCKAQSCGKACVAADVAACLRKRFLGGHSPDAGLSVPNRDRDAPDVSMSFVPSMKPIRFGRSSANRAGINAVLVQEFTKPRFLRFGKRP